MIKQILLEGFNKNITAAIRNKGTRVFNNDLIKDINVTVSEDYIIIKSSVVSESLFSEYVCNIEISNETKEITSTYCSCADFEKNEFKKVNYCCKHIAASFYGFLKQIDRDSMLREALTVEKSILNAQKNKIENKSDIINELIDDSTKEEVRFQVVLNRNNWSSKLMAVFKIGMRNNCRFYIIRDINAFLLNVSNNVPVKFSKNFEFSMKKYKLSFIDRRLLKFMFNIRKLSIDNYSFKTSQDKLIDGKFMYIPDYMIKEFLHIVKNNSFFLGDGFFYREIESEIIENDIPLPFFIEKKNNEIILEAENGMPVALNSNEDVFLFKTSVYMPSLEQCERLSPYLKVFNSISQISFPKEQENQVLKDLIPALVKTTDSLLLGEKIRRNIVMAKPKFNFYFDNNKKITLILKVDYDGCEFNYFDEYKEKVIYRDSSAENEILGILRNFNFEAEDKVFYFSRGDDEAFNFFRYDINKLQSYGEVYYSENFKGIKNISKSQFKGTIEHGKYNYFEFKFALGDIDETETYEILKAFRNNVKYFKLKNGEFLDLENRELKDILTLLDNISDEIIEKNTIRVSLNKGAYMEDFFEEKNIRYIKNRSEIKILKEKLDRAHDEIFHIPESMCGKLRPYQKYGYNWLRTLDYLGFGGILGDEMGLGKTIQAITFILAKKGSKTLIVVPTSLIYNWKNEFARFAPDMKVAIGYGGLEERINILNKFDDYDVYITTYNLLRRDLSYFTMNFDYMFIDEAQNIKNSSSQNAKSVKSIKACRKFALTGTPLENSLMELWSIFDYIMPDYLYDEKRFNLRYYRRLQEGPEIFKELNRLIKPFILRRYKKDVIGELPDKIEKRLVVPLHNEQRKVYETYCTYVKDLIAKKVEDSEFNKSRIEILSYITKLRQLCLDPGVVMNNYSGESSKIECLLELVHNSIEEGHKILVFSQFTSVLKNIAAKLNAHSIKYLYLDGSISSKDRMKLVRDFNEGDHNVFLISLKAGGTGLNLTSADVVIHFDPWWNPAVEDQATDRAHRIGQKNIVEVIKLVCQGTIEEKIIELQDSKRQLIGNILGDDLSSSNITSLSHEDILSLFN